MIEVKQMKTLNGYEIVDAAAREKLASAAGAVIETVSGVAAAAADSSEQALRGLKLYGKSTQDGIPAVDAPVDIVSAGDGGTIEVRITGKNMIPYPYVDTTKTANGVTFTDNGDGSVTVKGTATAAVYFALSKVNYGAQWLTSGKSDGTFSLGGARMTYNSSNHALSISISSGMAVDETIYPQMEYGAEPTEWEQPGEVQVLSVRTPDGLRGIPVESDGTCTDSNGQNWLCDEIDFARGVIVKRIGRIDTYAAEDVGAVYMSSTGELTAGAVVLYPLAEPIETPLTDTERTAYAALHTNNPNTTVYANETVVIEMTYTADTKTYIREQVQNVYPQLYGKSLLVEGDSIAVGSGNNEIGFGDIIAQRNGMTITKNAVNTSYITPVSWSENCILTRIREMGAQEYDYIVLNGGHNDMGYNIAVGAVTENYTDEPDESTFCGAAEALCRELLTKFRGSKILFVLTHRKSTGTDYPAKQDEYFDALARVLEKWSIPYVDIRRQGRLSGWNDDYLTAYFSKDNGNDTHPNHAGYTEFYVPLIEAAMSRL